MVSGSDLSARQTRMLKMIREYLDEHDRPPTIREIGRDVDISSTSVVSYNLGVLERKGYILRERETSRGLRLTDSPSLISVPLVGIIAAGEPIRVPEDVSAEGIEGINVTTDLVSSSDELFALQVQGDSMIDDLVNDGDLVIIRQQDTANNGEMVAVWLKEQGETTLKRIHYAQGSSEVELRPAHPTMPSIFVPAEDVVVQGKVVCVIRQFP